MQQATHQFQFYGKAGEFFKIWIVNTMLTILTLGVYSAWAKVRTRKYFYNNTLLMNAPFDYLADPVKILKGRLLVLAVVVLYSAAPIISPGFQLVFIFMAVPLMPWVIIKAMRFNLYNSSYRNIRFHFSAKYKEAVWVFIGLPVLVAITLGLMYPYFVRARKKFVIEHSSYGTSQFSMSATAGQFYHVYFKASAIALLILLFGYMAYYSQHYIGSAQGSEISLFLGALALLFYPFMMIIFGYLYTSLANLVTNHTGLSHHQFESTLETDKICWLYFSNTLAVIFSLGLLIPWAMIRMARYRISNIALITEGDPLDFVAAEAERADAVGEELVDFLDIDIGL